MQAGSVVFDYLHNILDTAVKNRRVLTDDASNREDPSPLQTKGTANALQSGRMDGLPLLQHRPDERLNTILQLQSLGSPPSR